MAEALLTLGILAAAAVVLLGLVAWTRRHPSPDRPRKTGPGEHRTTGTRDRPGGPDQEHARDSELRPGETGGSGS